MESLLHVLANWVTLALQAVAIVIVVFGSARAVYTIARGALVSHPRSTDLRTAARSGAAGSGDTRPIAASPALDRSKP